MIDKDFVQIFATSCEINNNRELMESYLSELEKKRTMKILGRNVTWLICGENNVLRNIQSNSNRVEFGLQGVPGLKERFEKIYQNTEIFVNPTHTIMGNQGKLNMRREFLSRNGVYISTSNADTSRGQRLDYSSIQYVYQNGRKLEGTVMEESERFVLKNMK